MILRILGSLLLVAAALKVHGLVTQPAYDTGSFSGPWLQTLAVEWEIALGLWLLCGIYRSLAWLCAFITFLAFSAVSLLQGLVGTTSCSCFGQFGISPWFALAIDLTAVASLITARGNLPATNDQQSLSRLPFASIVGIAGCLSVFLTGFVGYSYYQFGSLDAAIAALRAETISVRPSLVDIGAHRQGEATLVEVELINRSDNAILVYGSASDCACNVIRNLPLRLSPQEHRVIHVEVHASKEPGRFTHWVRLLTDSAGARVVAFRIRGHVFAS